MDPVQTSHDVSKSKVADHAIRDSISNHGAERAFRIQFQSVSEFEPAESQSTGLISSKSLETDISLFQEDTGGAVRIGRVIRRPEAELSLRSRCNGVRGQADQPRLSQLKQPIVRPELPAGRDTKQRRTVAVAVVARPSFEEIPILESKPEAAADRPTRNAYDSW